MPDAPTRPVLRWHGGKWKLAPWIVQHIPPHRIYVEPFGGAASVLLRKPRSHGEVYNDLDDEVVTLFRVLRNSDQAKALLEALRLTPYARGEFQESYEDVEDPVERARRLVVRSFLGFGSNAHSSKNKGKRTTGFRANANRNGTTPAHDWANYPNALEVIIDRLHGVTVECRPALEVMRQHDSAVTLHYVDPPYLHGTRSRGNPYDLDWRMYRFELSDEEHAALLQDLQSLKGMVILSGYPSDLYDDLLTGWTRKERETYADGARPRTECLWLNPHCVDALGHGPLWKGAA